MLAVEIERRPAAPTSAKPPVAEDGLLRLADVASDWLYRSCGIDGRRKLLEQHGFKPPALPEFAMSDAAFY